MGVPQALHGCLFDIASTYASVVRTVSGQRVAGGAWAIKSPSVSFPMAYTHEYKMKQHADGMLSGK